MRSIRFIAAAAVLAACLSASVDVGRAQQSSPDFFVPRQRPAAPPPASRSAPRQSAPQTQTQVPPPPPMPGEPPGAQPEPQLQLALPPPPELPALPKGVPPPVAVIGVLGVPEVMRASTAAQQVEKTIGARREKLNQDAQKEQAAWRDQQQVLANQKNGLSPEQIRAKERELQERITAAQRQFRDRNRIIQAAAQFGFAQVERTLVSVIRQVAESRGMNLVLHRAQVALNVNEFDLTDEVTEQLNKVLASVVIPPDGVAPPTLPAGSPEAAAPATASAAVPSPAATSAPAAASTQKAP